MTFKTPKPAPAPDPVPVPNVADASNRIADARRTRIASGGRNATFLANVATATSPSAGPVKTLTGLQGG